MMNDILGLAGLVALSTGLTVRYGWDVAAIIGGVILLALAVIGAMRR